MNNNKKAILALMVLSAMSLKAAEDKIIYVTTFADEFNANSKSCSLRAALYAAKENKAFAGCSAGNTNSNSMDYIQLKAGTYVLNSELKPETDVTILGEAPLNYDHKDPLTLRYPSITDHITTISGNGQSRIFNTSESKANLSLYDMTLDRGKSTGLGGALFVAGTLSLNNTSITNSNANAGGALYIAAHNNEKQIKLVNAKIEGNTALNGSVIAMDCKANLLNAKPVISIEASSILNNGDASSNSMIDLCGEANLTLVANTVTKNRANGNQGAIFKMVNDSSNRLSALSNIYLNSNTVVDNDAASTLLYGNEGIKTLTFNVFAFNKGKSCRYALNNGNVKDIDNSLVKFSSLKNAYSSDAMSGVCDIPSAAEPKDEKFKSMDLKGKSLNQVLYPLQTPSAYNLYLPLYYPIDLGTDDDLVNVGVEGCSDYDQRSLARITNTLLALDPDDQNTCEIGSVEIMRMTAADIDNSKNISLITLLDQYQANIDQLEENIKDASVNKGLIKQYQEDLVKAKANYSSTKNSQYYRPILIDPFNFALRNEQYNASGNYAQLQELNSDNFNVIINHFDMAEKGKGADFIAGGFKDKNLKCVWDNNMKRIVLYRTDDTITQATESAYCSYTIQSKAQSNVSSTGLIQGEFVNIAPVAKDDSYTIKYGSDLKVRVNPLSNDSDGGDGTYKNKPQFYHEGDQELAIRFSKIPSGVVVTADRIGQCPGEYRRETCYGGNIDVQVKNSFSPFNYSLEYSVFDADAEPSNTAQITLINTAKNTNTSSSGGGGGGGSLGIAGLMGLIGLALYRSRRKI